MSPLSPLSLLERFLPRIRSPWLVVLLAALLVADLLTPDPLPFVDEAVLAVLTVLAASWRRDDDDPGQPPLDITPESDRS